LTAEPDDGLLLRAVAVVFEALTVEVDEAQRVLARREDVVREEPVAVVRRLLSDFRGADRAVPYEWGDIIERARGRGEPLQRGTEIALVVHDVLGPEAVQEVVVLEREGEGGSDVLPKPRVHGRGVAAAQHEVHAALREVLQ